MRKTLITIIIILIILAIGLAGYWFFFLRSGTTLTGGQSTSTPFSFFPFGQTVPVTEETTTTQELTNQFQQGEETAVTGIRLRQITTEPTSGAFMFDIKATTTSTLTGTSSQTIIQTFIRYIDRATGHMYETKTSSPTQERITNTTIPKIYEAIFTDKGNGVIVRYLRDDAETIDTFYAKITTSTTTGETGTTIQKKLTGEFLPVNTKQIAYNKDQNKIFYLTETANGSVGTISENNGSKKNSIFISPLKYWLIDWPKTDILSVTTKPYSRDLGYLYFINTKTGIQTKILSDILGLTALVSPDASKVLYSSSNGGTINLSVYTVKDGTNSTFQIKTLPEKCVWSKNNKDIVYCAVPDVLPTAPYPDTWYKGLVLFNDNFWKIDTKTGDSKMIFAPDRTNTEQIDAYNLSLNESENTLIFINKNSLTLWSLALQDLN